MIRDVEILDYEGVETPRASDLFDSRITQPIYNEAGEVPGCYRTTAPKSPDEADPE